MDPRKSPGHSGFIDKPNNLVSIQKFEDLVIGHFRNHAHGILTALQAYMGNEVESTINKDAYTYSPLPRVPLSFQASACSLSTLHFLKFSENSFEVLKILENKLELMKILENKLESLKLQENQPVDGLVPLSIKKVHIQKCFVEAVKE
ncbi:hypothetical protein Tco_0752666 [Tanacetum coccineum]|uniref:Uncharacterized protein n=1 Tax=Tanacetum coccineum TaxID=301880 RepID=A0ABQ4ZAS7_9ASTR